MKLAAVRRRVTIGGIGATWRPALDKVWEFLRTQPDLRTNVHNVFLYHHPARAICRWTWTSALKVTRAFESAGEVYATETPAGMAVMAMHMGAQAAVIILVGL
jgi:hypothetical protein